MQSVGLIDTQHKALAQGRLQDIRACFTPVQSGRDSFHRFGHDGRSSTDSVSRAHRRRNNVLDRHNGNNNNNNNKNSLVTHALPLPTSS